MAILGAQLVITLIMISVIQKLGPHFSFAKWLICSTGLIRYLYPTNDELKQLANIPKDKSKGRKNNRNNIPNEKTNVEKFHVDRSLDIRLETAKVTYFDVIHLRYYSEYQWLVDFSVYAIIVYVLTEIYQIWFPLKDEINLSIIWCFLVVLFALKLLISLTIQYFKGEESVGERSTCIVMAFIYLLISMIILIVDENTLELGLENAYSIFNDTASTYLRYQGLNSSGPASKIVVKFFIAIWCSIVGAIVTFPGMRIAKMHWDLLRYFKENKLKQLLLNLSFALPFLLIVLWVKPVSKDYLTIRIFSGRTEPLMSEKSFEIARIIAIFFTLSIKLLLMPWYLQAYLDMAYHRTEEQKKEAGRITNIEFQKKIAAVFYYLCVVALQYITPLIICLFLSLMYKTLGEFQWNWLLSKPTIECSINDSRNALADKILTLKNAEPVEELFFTLDSIKAIFSATVLRGIFGFATWWCCFIYFATTSVGLVYQSYFSII